MHSQTLESGYGKLVENPILLTDFRAFLQAELIRRCRLNPKYSLRAFAKFLNVEPSFLSKLLSQKRTITPKTYLKLSQKLGLSPSALSQFSKKTKEEDGDDYRQMTLDTFEIISEWYHLAILELVRIDEFECSATTIARALSISHSEAQAAIDRLQRLGFLNVSNKKRWKNIMGSSTHIGASFTTAAQKNFQRQILEKAIRALDEIPFEKRSQSGMTMAIDPRLLPEAKILIQNFRRRLCHFLQAGRNLREVYHCSVSLFPLTNLQSSQKTKTKEKPSS